MDAKKCDRCGEFYITRIAVVDLMTVNRLYVREYRQNMVDKDIDLCPECKHDLNEWFNKFKKEEQEDT